MTAKTLRPSFDAAIELVFENVATLGSENVPLEYACGRVPSAALSAKRSSPPYNMSAMDGYAICQTDIDRHNLCFEAGPEIFAGAQIMPEMRAGIAFPISTGARVPPGCGTVVLKERAERCGGRVRLSAPPERGRNIRREAEDAQLGDVILRPGQLLTPAAVGALASFGITEIELFRKPRAALLITGDEVDAQLCDANGPAISAALMQRQIAITRKCRVPDDRCTLRQEINSLLSDGAADLIISTGGVSIGPRDYILDVLKELGAVIHFHGVAMRPGKPVLFATLPGGLPYFGLPGNPVAALVGFRFFVSTGLRKMQGLPVEQGTYFDLNLDGRKDLTVVLKASAKLGDAPVILAGQESHKMLPLIGSNCWIAVTDTGGLRTTRHFPLNARF